MIIAVPAIDLLHGQCVRLMRGQYDQVTHYHDRPVVIAQQWEAMGAPLVHVVDLDAARSGGETHHTKVISEIAQQISIPIQTGGGIRSADDVIRRLDEGIYRVIIGTAAVCNPDLVDEMIRRYGPDRVAIGIDAKDGEVRVSGWLDNTGIPALEFALDMQDRGVTRIIYTDINRDGTMQGPNVEAYHSMGKKLTSVRLMASGGVSGPEDLEALLDVASYGVDSVIIGRALYEGKFSEHQLWNSEVTECP